MTLEKMSGRRAKMTNHTYLTIHRTGSKLSPSSSGHRWVQPNRHRPGNKKFVENKPESTVSLTAPTRDFQSRFKRRILVTN